MPLVSDPLFAPDPRVEFPPECNDLMVALRRHEARVEKLWDVVEEYERVNGHDAAGLARRRASLRRAEREELLARAAVERFMGREGMAGVFEDGAKELGAEIAAVRVSARPDSDGTMASPRADEAQ